MKQKVIKLFCTLNLNKHVKNTILGVDFHKDKISLGFMDVTGNIIAKVYLF